MPITRSPWQCLIRGWSVPRLSPAPPKWGLRYTSTAPVLPLFEFNPKVIIEAKTTEDDGTARDKVTRIQHLGELSVGGAAGGKQKYQVIACIAGRGFGVRREDMKKMLLATRGKVFTLKTLDQLVEYSNLRKFKTKV